MTWRSILAAGAALAAAGAPAGAQQAQPYPGAVPAGDYVLDRRHASLLFRVDHLGFSKYTARFTRFDAKLHFDPENPQASRLEATVDPASLETDFPDPQTLDFNAQIEGPEWLDAGKFPKITYRSTGIELTGDRSARIDGELTLHGVTRPMALDATFNGGYAGHPMDPVARIGFSAHGTLRRSEFGMDTGVPPPGSTLGVGDDVEVIIEAEFSGPPLQPPPQTAPPQGR